MAKRDRNNPVTVGFVALGCPKNVVDSEKILADLGQAGFVLGGDVDNADVVVINTCGFIEPAKQEALSVIRQAVAAKKKGRVRAVVVAGCLSQRMGDSLMEEVKGIDAVAGLAQRDRMAGIVSDVLKKRSAAVQVGQAQEQCHDDRGRLLITPGHYAYLRISEGCDRRCAFCTIPAIRGAFRSKPPEMVLAEALELVESGVVELNIIAQDSNYYGRDMGITGGLARLIGELDTLEVLEWIRVMYLYPATVDDELIETMAASKKCVPYIDMPIQHINDDILRAMRRTDTKAKTTSLVEKLRQAMPGVTLRTTVIVGFPGESEQQFAELLEFIEWARFDALGCFPFYPEAGTPAGQMAGQIDEDTKQARLDAIMTAQQRIAFEKNEARVGQRLKCLVDEVEADGQAIGRHCGQAPGIDSVCKIESCSANAGEFIEVCVKKADNYDIVVAPVCD